VGLAFGVDPAADLGYPQLDIVMDEDRERQCELSSGERSLGFADDDRIELSLGAGTISEESRRLGSSRPGQRP
jgi:hypothetical protein